MLAVHGFWSLERGLCLWAEDAQLPVKSRSQALRSVRPHPFAAPADELNSLHPGEPGIATLLLPSLRTAPLDSPELVRVAPRRAPTSAPALLRWAVPVVSLPPAAALQVLQQRPDDVRYGASIHLLREVAAFATELVERGRVLPAVVEENNGWAARWRSVLQGPDLLTAQVLIAVAPPVLRAEARDGDDERGHRAADVVGAALDALVDAAACAQLGRASLLPPRRGRPPRSIPVAETWLTALTAGDGRLDADPHDVDGLRHALGPWAAVGMASAGPARATFRLVDAEPELPGDDLGRASDGVGETPVVGLGHEPDDVREASGVQPGAPPDQPPARAGWSLEFLLQSAEDPSLMVPTE